MLLLRVFYTASRSSLVLRYVGLAWKGFQFITSPLFWPRSECRLQEIYNQASSTPHAQTLVASNCEALSVENGVGSKLAEGRRGFASGDKDEAGLD